jgi:creatinine amidohydrolase
MRTVQFELLRPDEIVAERERVPLVYVPLGPLEWHSLHMPVGTDALNAQGVARRAAERTGGVVMPTFFWGTERERPSEMVRDLGFNEEDYIVGMDFPRNMLKSLYCREEFLALLVRELLDRLIQLEYKLIVLVNGHGALNQIETLDRLAREFTACSPARVQLTIAFPVNFDFKFGIGHADAAEASLMMAMHPDTVNLGALPRLPEPLSNVDWAIVDSDTFRGHPSPDHTLSEEADPRRHASAEVGHRMIEQTVAEIEQIVREALNELGYPPPP